MDTDRITKNPNPEIICSGTARRAGRHGGGGTWWAVEEVGGCCSCRH